MKRSTGLMLVAILALLIAGGASRAGTDESRTVGELFFEDSALDGAVVASGRMIEEGRLFTTPSRPAIVHLDNGNVLRFAANSSARFALTGADQVVVKVLSGRLTAIGPTGRVLHAGGGSRVRFGPSTLEPLAAESALVEAAESKAPRRQAERRR